MRLTPLGSPHNGRFVGRDPIEERGGLNLYAFVANNSINNWDYLGMSFWDWLFDSNEEDEYEEEEEWDEIETIEGQAFVVKESALSDGELFTYDLDLQNRVEVANSAGVDIDLSIFDNFGGASSAPSNVEDPKSVENSDCAGLRERRSSAQTTLSRNESYFNSGGQYTNIVGDLSAGERSIIPNSVEEGSLDVLDNLDRLGLAGTVGGPAAAYWERTERRVASQGSRSSGEMTHYKNHRWRTTTSTRLARGVGAAGLFYSLGQARAAAVEDDWAMVGSHFASATLSGISQIPGIGYGVGLVHGGFGLGLSAQQVAANIAYKASTLESARMSINTIESARNAIKSISAEMTGRGCD